MSKQTVAIVGDGIAGSALAIALLASGIPCVLFGRPQSSVSHTIEALSEATLRVFQSLDLLDVVKKAGGLPIEGLNVDGPHTAYVEQSQCVLVSRERLAAELRAVARARGARTVERAVREACEGERDVRIDGLPFVALVDASGRASRFGHPLRRRAGWTSATFWSTPPSTPRGTIIAGSALAYRFDHPDGGTVAVVAEERHAPAILCARLGVDGVPNARRPAGIQWTAEPIRGRRISIGDAAFAMHPIAGQGVRFAVQSALACSAVVRTWREENWFERPLPAHARAHYADLVASVRARHVLAVGDEQDRAHRQPVQRLEGPLRFVSFESSTCVHDGRVVESPVLRSRVDGVRTRYLGALDLFELASALGEPFTNADLRNELSRHGLVPEDVESVIAVVASEGWVMPACAPA